MENNFIQSGILPWLFLWFIAAEPIYGKVSLPTFRILQILNANLYVFWMVLFLTYFLLVFRKFTEAGAHKTNQDSA